MIFLANSIFAFLPAKLISSPTFSCTARQRSGRTTSTEVRTRRTAPTTSSTKNDRFLQDQGGQHSKGPGQVISMKVPHPGTTRQCRRPVNPVINSEPCQKVALSQNLVPCENFIHKSAILEAIVIARGKYDLASQKQKTLLLN